MEKKKPVKKKLVKKKKKAVKKENLPAVIEGGLSTMSPAVFEEGLRLQKAQTLLLKKYIADQLVDGVDYGRIHIVKTCPNHKKAWNQKGCPDYHFSKRCLFKPGSEKFCNLLKLRAEYEKDEAVMSMIPDEIKLQGVIAIKCNLVSIVTGKVVAEGHGACTLEEKKGQINTAIKITEKRSKVDAVLALGLSDTFTQDEDVIKENAGGSTKKTEKKTTKKAEPINITPESEQRKIARFYKDTDDQYHVDFGKEHKDKFVQEVPTYWFELMLKEGFENMKTGIHHAFYHKIGKLKFKNKYIDDTIKNIYKVKEWGDLTELQQIELYKNLKEEKKLDEIGEESQVEPEPSKKKPE